MAKDFGEALEKTLKEGNYNPNLGECQMCGTEYEIYKEIPQYQRTKPVPQDCPSCSYNPVIESIIERIIDLDAKVTFVGRSSIHEFNSKELSEKIVDTIKNYWPKPE